MQNFPRFLGETITLGELWQYLAREDSYSEQFVTECMAKEFERAGFSEERKPHLFSFPFSKFSPWHELLCCWCYFDELAVRHPHSGEIIGGAKFPSAMQELDTGISNAVIHRNDFLQFLQRRKLPPLGFWADPNQSSLSIQPQRSDSRTQRTPAELLYMHAMDPATWTRKKLAEEFFPGNPTAPYNTKKSWLQRCLSKAKKGFDSGSGK